MFRLTRRWMISVVIALLAAPVLGMGGAESKTGRTPPPATEPARHPPDQQPQPRSPTPPLRQPERQPLPAPPVMVRGNVFVGGYFYDTAFGPYPWWPEGY